MLVDSHCHLDFPEFAPELDQVVARARAAGVGGMVTICTRLTEFERVLAVVDGEAVTISIFDYPSNTNFPAYWHARGYGLFAVNPLGRKIFTNGKEPALNFTLAPKQSVTFRYRVLITSGKTTAESTEAAYKEFVAANP